jgi:archaellum component FlaC
LAPKLTDISQRLTHVEAGLDGVGRRFDGIDHRLDGIDKRLDALQTQIEQQARSMHNEFEAPIEAVRSDIRRLDNLAELRERLASVETKLAQRG